MSSAAGLLALALVAGTSVAGSSEAVSQSASSPAQPGPEAPAAASSGPVAASPSNPSAPQTLGGASAPAPATPIPSNVPERFSLLDPHTWPFSLVPVPEIATDPNQGTTIGLLPVFLFNDEHHHIHDILAPDVTDNTIVGAGGTFRFLAYPSEDRQWYVILGASQNIARKVDLFYSTGRAHSERWSFEGRFYFERDPTERFFGIGNETMHGGQSNFTTQQLYALATATLNITQQLQVSLTEKPRYKRLFSGALHDLPFIGKLYPSVKGLKGGTEMMNRLVVSYDTRDSQDIPRSGGLVRAFVGLSDRRFLSSSSYTQVGGEARGYVPLGSRVTLASHVFLQYTPAGSETPFWTMARLGGEDSLLTDQQTLRGYGAGRFVDNNLSVANVEMRSRVYELNIFDTHGIIEMAPFLEAGRVFHAVRDDPVVRLHPVGGVGFRGIAEPFVVGYVDVGVGGEGASIFSGINYPF
jgi:surface antigen Omp85-like protein